MILISFADQPERIWGAANWIGRRLFRDMVALVPNDTHLIEALETAEAHQCLFLEETDRISNPQLVEQLETVLRRTLRATLTKTGDSALLRWEEGLSPEDREVYLRAIRELAALLEVEEKRRSQSRTNSRN